MKNLIHHKRVVKLSCDIDTIDSFLSKENIGKLALIKLDTEGSELRVLKGALNTLKKERPPLMVEIVDEWCREFGHSSKDVTDYLTNLGYQMFISCKKGTLQRVSKVRSKDIGLYNYFFIHPSNPVIDDVI